MPTGIRWIPKAASTFVVTTLNSAPPVGVYGVSLGVLPSNLVPNGNVIRVGQREQHYALAEQ